MKNFHPEGLYVWDTWYYEINGEVHCVFLQQARPEAPENKRLHGSLGHAVSRDMLHWEHKAPILSPSESGKYDDDELWTGSAIIEGGKVYLYYAANQRLGENYPNLSHDSSIALAISEDGYNFKKYEGNPVLNLDPSIYTTKDNYPKLCVHGFGRIDCRDLCVVRDVEGNGYWGYFAARIPADECAKTSVIGLAHSDDLLNWEHRGVCFAPDRYACIEVPNVFYLDGKWWMLCLTGNMYGQRSNTGQPDWTAATVQAVADNPFGPFKEVYGHEVLGSFRREGFSASVFDRGGRKYMFYTHAETMAGSSFGSISFPVELKVVNGHLEPKWNDTLDGIKRELLPTSLMDNDGRWGSIGKWSDGDSIGGYCETDWSVRLFENTEDDMIMEAYVTLEDADAAGFIMRVARDNMKSGAYEVLLDAERGEILFTQSRNFAVIGRKRVNIEHGREYHLRVMSCKNVFTVYLDDTLVINLFDKSLPTGKAGLFVERGGAKFRDVRFYGLID